MDGVLSSASPELPELLRAARELVGSSRAALARSMDLSWETVRQAEEGRVDPQAATLALYLDRFPFLSPAALLGGSAAGPPLAARAHWELYRGLFGFVARRVVLELDLSEPGRRRERLQVLGLRSLRGRLEAPDLRTNLMQAVARAEPGLLRALRAEDADLERGSRRFEDSGQRHEYRFPRALHREGFDYTRTREDAPPEPDVALMGRADGASEAFDTLAWDADHPTRELELRVRFPEREGLQASAFLAPNAACPPGGAFALARAVHADGLPARWDPRERLLAVRVKHPLPELRHGLAWNWSAEDGPGTSLAPRGRARHLRLGAAPGGDSLGERVVTARSAAGLSGRRLARAMGVSPASLLALERGRDPRRSTLCRLLESLPGLEAAALFPGLRPSGPLAGDGAWLYHRNLWGMEADEAVRETKLSRNGDALEEISMRGLRRLGGPGELVVRDGISPAIQGRVGSIFVDQDEQGDRPDVTIRWRRLPGEQPEFLLTVPPELASEGASFTRREEKTATYKMSSEQSRRSIGPAFQCQVPTRRLRLAVHFPKGYWPLEVRASVRAATNITNPRWPDLGDELHPDGLRLELAPERGRATLTVERPLLGFRYSVRWLAP